MILNNFKKLLIGAMCNTTSLGITLISGEAASYGGYLSLGFYSNVRQTYTYDGGNTGASSTNASSLAYNAYSLTFGNGTTDPDPEDYQIETPYDTTDHFTWASISQTQSEKVCTKTLTGTIINTSTDGGDLTISEVGVVATGCTTSATYTNHILIARSVITPVTLSYGATRTFQYTLDFSGLNDGVS